MSNLKTFLLGLVFVALSFCTLSAETVVKMAPSKIGNILVDNEGKTLYVYSEDKKGVSSCDSQCAQTWPPLFVTADQQPKLAEHINGKLGVITRKDGKKQVTYNGMPLYYYFKDKEPGDTSGQNFDQKWTVVRPADIKQS
jgi:predicted lipoprotein with Yx(FWY)xxD motif